MLGGITTILLPCIAGGYVLANTKMLLPALDSIHLRALLLGCVSVNLRGLAIHARMTSRSAVPMITASKMP